jgi:hypothetical protein
MNVPTKGLALAVLVLAAIQAKGEEGAYSASALPPAPIAIQSRIEVKHGLNRYDYALYGGILVYRAGDYMTSEKMFKAGAVEGILPRVIVDNRAGFIAFSAGMAAIEIGSSYMLHKHGHAKLARIVDSISVGAGVANDVHNYQIGKWEWTHRPDRNLVPTVPTPSQPSAPVAPTGPSCAGNCITR